MSWLRPDENAEDSLNFTFSAGMALIRKKNNADSVLRPQRGVVRPDLAWDFVVRTGRNDGMTTVKEFSNLDCRSCSSVGAS